MKTALAVAKVWSRGHQERKGATRRISFWGRLFRKSHDRVPKRKVDGLDGDWGTSEGCCASKRGPLQSRAVVAS